MDKITLETHLTEALEKYYQSKVAILEQLKLDDILFDKNFYMLRIQRIWSIQDLLNYLIDAYLQKHEETTFKEFWQFISDNETLYTDIIEPLGHQAKEKNEEFLKAYSKVVNQFTLKFAQDFCDGGVINWQKIVEFNSKRKPKVAKATNPKAKKSRAKKQ
jgi:hypothetical protein